MESLVRSQGLIAFAFESAEEFLRSPRVDDSACLVTDVQKGVLEIRPMVGIEDGTQISEKSVKEVGDVTKRLIQSIATKN